MISLSCLSRPIAISAGCSLALLLPAGAQDFAQDLPAAPTGFAGALAMPGESILDGFSASVNLSGTYDSNVTLGGGRGLGAEEDDFILSAGTNLAYRSQGRDWVFGGSYRASYDEYLSRSSLSGFNHGAGFVAGFDGPKLKLMYNLGISFDRGANRYYSSFVERTNYSHGLTASYRISPKTSLSAGLSYSDTRADGGSFADTESFSANLAAMWQATPLIQVGPGIRYSLTTGSRHPDRETLGPTLNASYRLTSKVSLSSTVGMDFVSYDGGSYDDTALSASLAANYRASALWGMSLSIHRGTQADPRAAGAFNEVTSVRLGYNRRIRRLSLNLGASYEHNDLENRAGAAGGFGDRNYWSLDSSLGMPIFGDSASASIFAGYRESTGGQDTWDGYQTGFNISYSF